MIKFKSGFSLLEILIGFFLLAGSAVVFFMAVNLFKKETVFYTEHFVASALLDKFMETCYQETELNPHGIKALGLSDDAEKKYKTQSYVTDGETIFFRNPEISSKNLEVLHDLLKGNFKLQVETDNKNGCYQVQAQFDWTAKYGKGFSLTPFQVLSTNLSKEVKTSFELPLNQVEALLLKNVFESNGGSLAEKINSNSAKELATEIGHVYFACFELFSSPDFQNRCREAKELEKSADESLEKQTKSSEKYFELARDTLHLMVNFKPRLEKIQTNLDFLKSLPERERYILQGYVLKLGHYCQQLRSVFLACIMRLISSYQKKLVNLTYQREQRMVLNRIFIFYRLLYPNRSFCKTISQLNNIEQIIANNYKSFLSDSAELYQLKDPTIARMALQDFDFMKNEKLEEKYFLPRMLKDLFETMEKFSLIRFI